MQRKLHTYRNSVQVLLSFYTVFSCFFTCFVDFVRTQQLHCVAQVDRLSCAGLHKCLYYNVLQKATF